MGLIGEAGVSVTMSDGAAEVPLKKEFAVDAGDAAPNKGFLGAAGGAALKRFTFTSLF